MSEIDNNATPSEKLDSKNNIKDGNPAPLNKLENRAIKSGAASTSKQA